MKIITVINQKGGVGKSVISTNLAYGFSQLGKRTLLIDLDPQANSSMVYCEPQDKNINEIFKDRNFNINKAIYPAMVNSVTIENLSVIPSSLHLAATAESIAGRIHREKLLNKALQAIRNQFDYILIDCPPTLGVLAVNGIYCADELLIPVVPAKWSLDGVGDLFKAVEEIKENDVFKYRLIINQYEKRNSQTNAYFKGQLETVKNQVMKTYIRKSEAINQAIIADMPVFLYDPAGNGSNDFNQLIEEVLYGQVEPSCETVETV